MDDGLTINHSHQPLAISHVGFQRSAPIFLEV